ncbi:hypothetical protein M2367_000953 [Aeromonas sp. BIGb0445]|nr:hypothetical protein [Aeromonas sp. BIGb0445]
MVKLVGQQVGAFGHIKQTRIVCLSVYFFVPVIDKNGKSVPLPIEVFYKLGYNIEFTDEGNFEEYTIDFDALAEHLLTLKQAAEHHDIKIWRVVFDNELQKNFLPMAKGNC